MSRVYDMILLPAKTLTTASKRLLVVHTCNRGVLEFAEIDLESRTSLRVLN